MNALPSQPFADEPAPLNESDTLALSPAAAAERVAALPLTTRFRLGAAITPVQRAFLDCHGFLVFARVLTAAEVDRIGTEADAIQERLLADGVDKVRGVPVWIGEDPDGKPFLQRLAFTSLFSDVIRDLVRDPRLEPVRTLVGEGARVGDDERDGVVLNRYVQAPGSLRPGLGWHTDGLRDLFYNRRMPDPQLNVGLHLDRVRPEDGGLRLIPGSHTQGALSTIFRKVYFVSHKPDRNEVAVETWPGDLTVHDGRMWHRVQASPHTGWASLRRSMYVPYLTDAYNPKDEASRAPLYMRVFDAAMRLRKRWLGRARKQLPGPTER